MNTLNICQCGSQADYPHLVTCPYPLYRGDEGQVEKWLVAARAPEARSKAPVEAAHEVRHRLQER